MMLVRVIPVVSLFTTRYEGVSGLLQLRLTWVICCLWYVHYQFVRWLIPQKRPFVPELSANQCPAVDKFPSDTHNAGDIE